jgi:hypothetical protein
LSKPQHPCGFVACIVAVLSLAMTCAGCATSRKRIPEKHVPLAAVYLEPTSAAQLSPADMAAHPQVVAVTSQRRLETVTTTRVAIWVDKGAVGALDMTWLRARAELHQPIALIGSGDDVYSFRDLLPLVEMSGPNADWKRSPPRPGFSVWMLYENGPTPQAGYLRGLPGTPTVDSVLAVTNALREGRTPVIPVQ